MGNHARLLWFNMPLSNTVHVSHIRNVITLDKVAAAVGKQRGTRRAAHKDHDRSEGLAVAGPATWNSLPVDLRTLSLSRDTFAKKTQNSFIWLPALLRSSLIGRYTNWHIHSFIHNSRPIDKVSYIQLSAPAQQRTACSLSVNVPKPLQSLSTPPRRWIVL